MRDAHHDADDDADAVAVERCARRWPPGRTPACRLDHSVVSADHVAAGDGTRTPVVGAGGSRPPRRPTARRGRRGPATPSPTRQRSGSVPRMRVRVPSGRPRRPGRGRPSSAGATGLPHAGLGRRRSPVLPDQGRGVGPRRVIRPALLDVGREERVVVQAVERRLLLDQARRRQERGRPPRTSPAGRSGRRRSMLASASSAVKSRVPPAKPAYSSTDDAGLLGHDRVRLVGVGRDPLERQCTRRR